MVDPLDHNDPAAGVLARNSDEGLTSGLAIPDDALSRPGALAISNERRRRPSLNLLVLQTTIAVKIGLASAGTARNGEARATENPASTQQAF